MQTRIWLVLVFVFVLIFPIFSSAQIRETFTYQMKVVDTNYIPPVDGTYNFRFRIYDSLAGGLLLWEETHSGGSALQITNGVMTVELNSICGDWDAGGCISNGGVDFSSDSLYLEVQWDADGAGGTFEEVFTPRRRLTAAAYAQMAAGLTTDLDINFTDGQDNSIQWDEAAERTLTIENDDASNVANLAVEGQIQTGSFASAPTALGNGAFYYDTGSNELFARINGSWESLGGAGAVTLDSAYNNFGASASTITIDAAESQTGGLQFVGSLASDETISITNSANGGVLFVENTGTGDSFRVNDESSDTSPFVIDDEGKVGIGTPTPTSVLEVTGGNARFNDNVFVGNDVRVGADTAAAETLNNAGFTLDGDDLFVADSVGVEGSIYTDGVLQIDRAEDVASITLNDTTNVDSVSLYTGTGTPNGALSAQAGSLFLDQSGAAYVNTNGATAWTDLADLSGVTLDSAYNNFGANPSTVSVDAAESQTGGLLFDGSLGSDETISITNSAAGGTLFVENTGTGLSFRVNDTTSDTTPFVVDESGEVGIGTANPTDAFYINNGNQTIFRDDGSDVELTFSPDSNGLSWTLGAEDSNVGDFILSAAADLSDPRIFVGGSGGSYDGLIGFSTVQPLDELTLVTEQAAGNNFGLNKYTDDGNSANFNYRKARGTESTPTNVQVGDFAANFRGYGYVDGDFRTLANIRFGVSSVDTVADSLGGFLFFGTKETTDVTFVERMRIIESGEIGVGTITPDVLFHVEQEDATTNDSLTLLRLTHTSSGSPAAGLGSGLEFEVEDAADNTIAASIEGILTDVTDASENGALLFYTQDAADDGLAERMRIDTDGQVGIGVTPAHLLDIEGTGNVVEIGDATAADINLVFNDDDGEQLFGWDDSEESFSTNNEELLFRTHQGTSPPAACSSTIAGQQWMDTDTGVVYVCDTSNSRNEWLSLSEMVIFGDESGNCPAGADPNSNANCNVDWGNGLGPDGGTDLGFYVPYDLTITGAGFSQDDDACTSGSFDLEVWSTGSSTDDNTYSFEANIATGLSLESAGSNALDIDIAGDQFIIWGIDNNCGQGIDDWALMLHYRYRHDFP